MFKALRYYVYVDRKTRFRNNMICVAVAATLYMLCLARYTEVLAVKISLGVLFVSYAISTFVYVFRHKPIEVSSEPSPLTRGSQTSSNLSLLMTKTPQLSRRRLLESMGWLLVLVFAGVGTPLLEGAVVNRRLRETMEGEPTEKKVTEVAQIITENEEHNLHASPKLIVEAANQFASYRSSLQSLPLNVKYLTTLTATPDHGAPYRVNIGCVEGKSGGEARLNGVADFGGDFGWGLTLGNCSDMAFWPQEPVTLSLDNVVANGITFVNCTFVYKGGKLLLDNARFVNCTFEISAAYAKNRNVLAFLQNALAGQSINLQLS